tara:strand:- start:411 stop:599 length:189 start_codon:yes stop_codon:yes gene_type:complete
MKKFVKENYKGILLGLAVVGFQFSLCALISILTIKSAIAILLTLVSVVCLGIVKELVYIKLK